MPGVYTFVRGSCMCMCACARCHRDFEPKEQSKSHPARIISSIIKSCECCTSALLSVCLPLMAQRLSISSLCLCRMLMTFIVKLMAVPHSS